MQSFFERLDIVPAPAVLALAVTMVLALGGIDFYTGENISLSVAYLAPIGLATWRIGPPTGLAIAALSTTVWIYGDATSASQPESALLIGWNFTIRFLFYGVFVWVLGSLRVMHDELELRVEQRTVALTEEIAERERLEGRLLDAGEREQRRIGHDLHDGLCQHLTGTALASQVLGEKLAARGLPESADAVKIVELLEQGITLSRRLAKGLHPIEMEADGLMQSLQEFARTTADLFKVNCRFECESPVLIHNASTAAHLFRIAQEAVRNAIKHGLATKIVIRLEALETGTQLRVEDNGIGISEPPPRNEGMGIRIMTHRAKVIGGEFEVTRGSFGGTVVTCLRPLKTIKKELHSA